MITVQNGQLVELDKIRAPNQEHTWLQNINYTGSGGGSFTDDTFQVFFPNTIRDVGSMVTIGGKTPSEAVLEGEINLPAGTYTCFISFSVYDVGQSKCKLVSISGDSIEITGTCMDIDTTGDFQAAMYIHDRFTLTQDTVLRIEGLCVSFKSATGRGDVSANVAVRFPNKFLDAHFFKDAVGSTPIVAPLNGQRVELTGGAQPKYGRMEFRTPADIDGGSLLGNVWNNIPYTSFTSNDDSFMSRPASASYTLPSGTPTDPSGMEGILFDYDYSSYALSDGDPITTNWTDNSGNGHVGVPSGNPTWRDDGIEFDGSDDQFRVATLDDTLAGVSEYTFFAVVNMGGVSQGSYALFSYSDVSSPNTYWSPRIDCGFSTVGDDADCFLHPFIRNFIGGTHIAEDNHSTVGRWHGPEVGLRDAFVIFTVRVSSVPDSEGHRSVLYWGKRKLKGSRDMHLIGPVSQDGVEAVLGTTFNSNNPTGFLSFSGKIAQMTMFTTALSDSDLANVWAYYEQEHTVEEPNAILSPSDIGTLRCHLKADTGVTVADTDKVTNWVDQSGNAIDFQPVNDAARPTLVDNDYIRFDGSQYLEASIPASIATATEGTIIVIYRLNSSYSGIQFLLSGTKHDQTNTEFGIVGYLSDEEGVLCRDNGTGQFDPSSDREVTAVLGTGNFSTLMFRTSATGIEVNGQSGRKFLMFRREGLDNWNLTASDVEQVFYGSVSGLTKLIVGANAELGDDPQFIMRGEIYEIIILEEDIDFKHLDSIRNYIGREYSNPQNIKLEAGTYFCNISATLGGNTVNDVSLRLFNHTAQRTELISESIELENNVSPSYFMNGPFTLDVDSELSVQVKVTPNDVPETGLGVAYIIGGDNVFMVTEFFKHD